MTRPSLPLRLLLRAYPRWFRKAYGPDLRRHLALQREEARYAGGAWRYWRDVGFDTLKTGIGLRWAGARRGMTMGMWTRDVRHALRGLTRSPGYVLVFVVTLGLGIGANTAMFSAVNGVLLRPLPHDNGDRLIYLRHTARLLDIDNLLFSVPEIDDYRRQAPGLREVAEFSALDFTMLGLDEPRRVRAGIVSGNYFEMMGLRATLGRMIGREDDGREAHAVIVLSDAYWRAGFGADPEIVGKTIQINGRTATFVGVAEPAPPYPERTDIYVNMATSPHHLEATMKTDRVHRMTEVFARMAPGATLESVRAEVHAITARLHEEYPEAYDQGAGYDVTVTPLKTQLTSRARPTLLLALGTAFFVLIIACANLANLALTRVLRREHELAIRISLGGSRAALRRELLAESLLLGVGGAGLGLMIASVSLGVLVRFAERFTSRASEIALDGTVFGFALLVAVCASLFFTLVPHLPDGEGVGGALTRSGTRSTGSARGKRLQRALVVAQTATSFVLLIGAGLLLRSLVYLEHVDPGFDTAQILSMDVPPNTAGRGSAEIRAQFLGILRDVRAIPGVENAAMTSAVPLAGGGGLSTQFEIRVEGYQPMPGAPAPRADFRVVSPGYFATMGIDVVHGREFVSTDETDAQHVVVINEAMARAYFGDIDAVGKRIAWTDDLFRFIGMDKEYRTVVGVVADTRDRGFDAPVMHAMYTPYQQVAAAWTGSMVVRLRGEAATVLPAVRDVVLSYDPNQPIDNVATVAQLGSDSVAPQRLNAILLGGFALLALVIAAVGIGGVLAFSVGSRTREFGVRSALGAARRQVWKGVVAEGAALAGAGVLIGTVTALLLVRFVSGLLVGVPAVDPVTFVGVGLILAGVAVAASWAPAWRAASVNPIEALASE
jgi:putative ABC transport system permease protein